MPIGSLSDTKTPSPSDQFVGVQEARSSQWPWSTVLARSSGEPSVQGVRNGRSPGSCTPSAATCARAASSSGEGRRSVNRGVWIRRAYVGHRSESTSDQTSARSSAYAGLITFAIRASRSSNGRNADFIALTVNHSMSRTE